jgi:hypothetical protein
VQCGSEAVQELVSSGYKEYYVRWALNLCGGDKKRTVVTLNAWGAHTKNLGEGAAAAALNNEQADDLPEPPPAEQKEDMGNDAGDIDHDVEAEVSELVRAHEEDPMAAYDVDVQLEIEAWNECQGWAQHALAVGKSS